MKELIEIFPQQLGDDTQEINAVNARELFERLGSGRRFGNWIQDRLEDFDEGIDYICRNKNVTRADGQGGNKTHEYILTLDTAKHIAMLERNEIGKKIRQYFIEVEKKAVLFLEQKIEKLTEQKNSPYRSTQQTFTKVQHFHGKPILNILGKTKKSEVRIISFGYNKAIAICNNIKDILRFVEDIENDIITEQEESLVFSLDI